MALWLILDAAPQGPVGLWRWGQGEAALSARWEGGALHLQTDVGALFAPWSPPLGEPTHLQVAWDGAALEISADGFLLAQGSLAAEPSTLGPLWIGPWDDLAGWPGRLDAAQQVAAPEPEPDGIGFVPRCDGQHDPTAPWWPFDEGEGASASSPSGAPAFALEGAGWTDGLLGRYARDADRDAWGFEPEAVRACGKVNDDDVLRLGDCNDGNPRIYPTAPELPDLIDNDCDEDIDEASPMKTPVIVLGEVLFPGLTPALDLPRADVAALAAWQKALGFGALDVLLVPASDPGRAPGADNAMRVGVLASLALPDGWEQGGDPVPVEILESFRVKLKAAPAPNPKGWGGLEAEFIPAAPKAHGWDEGAQRHLRRLLHEWMLAAPQEVTANLGEPDLAPAVLLPALELAQAPAWATVYAASAALGADLAHRKALLEADEVGAEAARLETTLRDKLAALGDAERHAQATLAAALEQGVEQALHSAAECLEATAALEKVGAVKVDKELRERLKRLRRELEKLIPEAQRLIAQLGGDPDEDDDGDEE